MHRWTSVLLAAGVVLSAGIAGAALADCPPPVPPASAEQLRAAQQRDRGLLWRLVKDGRESWLYGTLHVGRPEWTEPGPALRRALARSDTLALEIDIGDAAVARQISAALRDAASSADLPAPLSARLKRQLEAACLEPQALHGLPPPMQGISLTLLAARHDALDAAYGQDLMLATLARRAGQRIVSLEDVASQLALLLPRDPVLSRELLDNALAMLESQRTRPLLRRLAAAWADGDLATIENYAQWCGCADSDDERAQLKRLNDDRNPQLAEAIDALHRDGRSVLAAVGALHMTGAMALPRLLAQRGYRVERIVGVHNDRPLQGAGR
jgi:uncharacterized protein YbaP (TraB family)